MAANMYRIGDYVYFETSSSSPYQIRRIEELNKTQSGNVEARVMCYYRRRDVPSSLTVLADKNQSAFEEGQGDCESVTDKVRHQINHRELFMTRHVETLPATHIRGKCAVTLLNETENQLSYLSNEDTFFYTLVYDPAQRTLLGDRGEIRVGTKYQADITPLLQEGEDDGRNSEELETLTWTAEHNISDRQIDQFLVIARSVGTFARALDCSSSVKQPSLHMSAAAASRDITLFHAMDTLHKHKYDLSQAISSLVPSSGPILCRDEMEEWAASEANLFEEALEKYGKDFTDIRQDFLPWKTLKNIVEYYYMWKTTDRYVQQKRVKAADSESKLKQVYIPNYNLTNPAVLTNNKSGVINGASNEIAAASGKACESCMSTQSSQWYAWGPMHMQCRLCSGCWVYWKKYGGLKVPTRLDDVIQPAAKDTAPKDSGKDALMCNNEKLGSQGGSHRPHKCVSPDCGKEFKLKSQLMRHCATVHGMALRAGSPRPIVKTRAAFFLCTGFLTRLARRMCKDLLKQRKAARNPFTPINAQVIKAEFVEKTVGKTVEDLRQHTGLIRKVRCKVNEVSRRLSMTNMNTPPWLILTDKNSIPKPENPAFPPPPRGPDGRYLVDPILNREIKMNIDRPAINNLSHNSLLRKRPYDDHNGPSPKKHHREGVTSLNPAMDVLGGRGMASRVPINHLNGRNKGGSVKINRKHLFSWMDAPDDVYFIATEATRKLRSQLTISELRRAGRKPFRSLNIKLPVLESTSAMNLSRFQ